VSKTCSKCGEAEAGPGGVLCEECRLALESAPLPYPKTPGDDYEAPTDAR
jgi:hypothetical protein